MHVMIRSQVSILVNVRRLKFDIDIENSFPYNIAMNVLLLYGGRRVSLSGTP